MLTVKRLAPTVWAEERPRSRIELKIKHPRDLPAYPEPWSVCFVGGNEEASLHSFIPRQEPISFLIPTELVESEIKHILLSPVSSEAKIDSVSVSYSTRSTTYSALDDKYAPCVFEPHAAVRDEVVLQGLVEYSQLKQRILLYMFGLSVFGTGCAEWVGGGEMASAFAFGGGAGLLYHLLLQYELDSIGKNDRLHVVNSGTRLMTLAFVLGTAVTSEAPPNLFAVLVGFWLNKLAMWFAFTL